MGDAFNKEDTEEFLRLIREINKSNTIASYIHIKNVFDRLSIPFPHVTVAKGQLLCRCRAHLKHEAFFTKLGQLAYRGDEFYIKDFGRTNEPGQSIFYCSDDPVTAFSETSIITRQNEPIEFEYITTGVWKVKEDFKVGYVPVTKAIKGLNKTTDGLNDDFERLVEKFKNSGTENHLNVLDFLSQEFLRNARGDSSNYKISCAFANYIYKAVSFDKIVIEGLLYSSTIYNRSGINLAILPTTVDNKLQLIAARKSKMVKTAESTYHELHTIDAKSVMSNGEIVWS